MRTPELTPTLSPSRETGEVLAPLTTVSVRQGLTPLARRLEDLRSWLENDLADLEASITRIEDKPEHGKKLRVVQAAEHLLCLPGKRIRPLCVVLAARLGGRDMDQTVRDIAVACELVHASTLLHDDVIDHGSERRGAPAARVLYGNSASILAGDYLLVEALKRLHSVGQPALLGDLLDVIARMVRAEAQQLERRGNFVPSEQAYLEVIRGKTAALFAWGLRAGGQIADMDEASLDHLAEAGASLGMAFQLVDDLLDLDGDARETGKPLLADVREGKLTWPIIWAAKRDPIAKAELIRLAQAGEEGLGTGDTTELLARIRRTGAIDATRAFALEEAEKACRALAHLPAGRSRNALELVVRSAVFRIS